ncbi:MAG: Kelch repeat-containing protein [Candidatus Rokuibacteriota bacterium]
MPAASTRVLVMLLVAVSAAIPAGAQDPGPGSWGRRAPLLDANSEMSVAELGGKIYVLGGYPSSRISVTTVQVYDPVADTWSLAAALPVALNHTMAAVVGGRLYLAGGQAGNMSQGPFVDTVYEYDPAANAWASKAPMPTARSSGASAVVDGKIYVAGGRPPRGHDFAVFDPRANAWKPLPDLPTQRNHLAAAAVDGKVYVLGGRYQGGATAETSDVVEMYDPRTNTWVPRAKMPRPRGGVNGVEALGCIHLFGGEGNKEHARGMFPDHDVYDPRADRWTRLDPMPMPVHGVTGLAFFDGLIYLPGGGTAQGGASGSTMHQVYRPRTSCR